jgi:hypothetical protein
VCRALNACNQNRGPHLQAVQAPDGWAARRVGISQLLSDHIAEYVQVYTVVERLPHAGVGCGVCARRALVLSAQTLAMGAVLARIFEGHAVSRCEPERADKEAHASCSRVRKVA